MAWVLTTKRRLVQIASLVLLTSNFWAFSLGRYCLPILHCEGCAWSWLGCPIGLAASSIAFREIPWLVIGTVLGLGVLVGRFFCGWVCPSGLAQDLLYRVPGRKLALPRWLGGFKYVLLAASVVAVAYVFGKDHPLFFCQLCPTAAVEVVIPDMIRHADWTLNLERATRFGILAVVLVLAAVNHRSFCKVFCPIGAMVAVTNKFSLFKLRLDAGACVHCKACDAACPMDVAVEPTSRTGRSINRAAECVECLSCEGACPTNAIRNNSRLLKK